MGRKAQTWENLYSHTIENENGCLEWQKCKDKDGYGVTSIKGRKLPAHRALWALKNSPEEILGRYVLHTCNNPSCIKLEHLYLGSQKDNVQDQIQNGTFVRGSKNGKSLLDELSVEHIRSSSFSINALAKYYDVSYQTVWDVRKRRSWRHLK